MADWPSAPPVVLTVVSCVVLFGVLLTVLSMALLVAPSPILPKALSAAQDKWAHAHCNGDRQDEEHKQVVRDKEYRSLASLADEEQSERLDLVATDKF